MKTNRISPRLIALLTAFAVGIATSPVPVSAAVAKKSDSKVKIYVEYKLAKEGILKDNNIKVDVTGRAVILSGTVPTLHDRTQVGKIVKKVDRHYAVVNDLSVKGPFVPDSALAADVLHRVENHVFYTVYDWLTVGVTNGVVTLHGWVSEPWEVQQYHAQAEKVPGVRKIINQLRVEMNFGYLRYRVANLIYRNPLFWQYDTELNPPVHVIVNNRTVILEGFVNSTGERGFLGSQVTFRTDAFNVVNHLQVEPG